MDCFSFNKHFCIVLVCLHFAKLYSQYPWCQTSLSGVWPVPLSMASELVSWVFLTCISLSPSISVCLAWLYIAAVWYSGGATCQCVLCPPPHWGAPMTTQGLPWWGGLDPPFVASSLLDKRRDSLDRVETLVLLWNKNDHGRPLYAPDYYMREVTNSEIRSPQESAASHGFGTLMT